MLRSPSAPPSGTPTQYTSAALDARRAWPSSTRSCSTRSSSSCYASRSTRLSTSSTFVRSFSPAPADGLLADANAQLGTRFDPELTLLVRAVLYRYSIWLDGASYGAKLQNLGYTSVPVPARNVLAHAALTILLPYAHARLRAHALSASWPDAPSFSLSRRVWAVLSRAEAAHALLALLNFLAFLYNGRCVRS